MTLSNLVVILVGTQQYHELKTPLIKIKYIQTGIFLDLYS